MTATACINCAFYNPESKYDCDFNDESPVICSVKMKKMKEYRNKKLEVILK